MKTGIREPFVVKTGIVEPCGIRAIDGEPCYFDSGVHGEHFGMVTDQEGEPWDQLDVIETKLCDAETGKAESFDCWLAGTRDMSPWTHSAITGKEDRSSQTLPAENETRGASENLDQETRNMVGSLEAQWPGVYRRSQQALKDYKAALALEAEKAEEKQARTAGRSCCALGEVEVDGVGVWQM